MSERKGYRIYGMPWYWFLVFAAIILITTYVPLGFGTERKYLIDTNLPLKMLGMFGLMIVIGAVLNEIGERTPIVRTYLGGGAIVTIFGTSALVYFNLLPKALVSYEQTATGTKFSGAINTFFAGTGGFLDWYIAALITGSILGMNRKLLAKAATRFLPAIIGGVFFAFLATFLIGMITNYGGQGAIQGGINALLLIALPIMGGGMGAGAVPMAQIFEKNNFQGALNYMVPAVAIGNTLAIVAAGLLPRIFKSKDLNGQGNLMKVSGDASEYELTPEEEKLRSSISYTNLGVGILVSAAFFCLGIIINNFGGFFTQIHAYAWMIIAVMICKILRILPDRIEAACYQWYQFMSKNLTSMLLVGIGAVYVGLEDVINALSIQYFILCLVTVIGAIIGAWLVSRWVGFYPVEGSITAGLCMANMGGTGDVACLSAADRMELMPFSQISSRIGGAFLLLIASLLLSFLTPFFG
ncbi:MAG: 2-hydroxycarboxylate transporter family protein [Bacilli bacterium]|nr:2-hydroxycarboxylate transporter family protein [Bacilli bacterium]